MGIERAKQAAKLLESCGHDITYRWWETIEAERAKGSVSDGDLSPMLREYYAKLNFVGVRGADVLVYIEPHAKSEGAAWELGVAYGIRFAAEQTMTLSLGEETHKIPSLVRRPHVIVVGERRSFMFSELCDARVPDIYIAVTMLAEIEKKRRSL